MTARRYASLSGFLFVLLFGTGCGEDCTELCEQRKQCRTARSDVDCADHCEQLEELVEDADCTEQFDALNECVRNQDDICDEDPESCESQSSSYTDCMSEYCMDHDCS